MTAAPDHPTIHASAVLVGAGAVLVLYAVTRTGSIAVPGFWPSALVGIGALVLGIAGMVVEHWCRIPPEDPARPESRAEELR